ncbi:T9SS type B sorting domain-containing protein [Ferruginibacter sp.]|nr:gliding motility-associated C-terminal domain-containing protein [Ferruginibacter sp.]
MISKICFIPILLFVTVSACSQQNFCADSSYRIRYLFDNNGAFLYNNPDTSGKNYFTGATMGGLALMKTNWGDSIYWAKKILMDGYSWNSYFAPNGTIVCTGNRGGSLSSNPELLICRLDTNGIMLWTKRYWLSNNHRYYISGNFYTKNLVITENAIYAVAHYVDGANTDYDIIVKLDLDGNIIWSKSFNNYYAGPSGSQTPTFANNKFYFFSKSGFTNTTSGIIIITALNDADGSISESFGYRAASDTLVKHIIPQQIKINADNSFSITGLIGTYYMGMPSSSNIFFNSLLDVGLNPVHNYYYKNNIPLYTQELYFDINNRKQKAILSPNLWNLNEKYFITFGSNDEVLRSRKLNISTTLGTLYRNSLTLDDKQNLHFVYQYLQSGKYVNEYARISNLAPNSTLGCFGKDTSILTRYPFTLNKEPFTWANVLDNVVSSNNVPYTEQNVTVTKEVVCKIVSYCDTVKISGPTTVCVGVPVRYTIRRNNTCLKNTDWFIDTAVANIVNLEGDSAITINFKKAFNGYIRAALTDCVVKDSFLVKAVVPKMLPLIKRTDSLLCPGKTLVLAANNGYSNYIWQGNTAGQQFTINAIGVYTITALDSCGITKTDSIRVILSDTSLTIPQTQTICLYDTAFITLPNDVNNITWQPTTNSYLNNKTLLFYPPQTTLYTITAERLPACGILKTTTVVIKICPQTVFIPNAFTPQKNGLNDIFKPTISQPLPFYRLQIFNRYGQTIFESSNQNIGWDGSYKGKQQPMGGYIYQCSYRFAGKPEKMVKGYFILVR